VRYHSLCTFHVFIRSARLDSHEETNLQTAKHLSSLKIDRDLLQKAIEVGLNPRKICENTLKKAIESLALGIIIKLKSDFISSKL
jgi:hypothetical protein